VRVKSLFANDHFLLYLKKKQKGKNKSDDAIHDTNMLTGCGLGEGGGGLRRRKKEENSEKY
jgi:hypothetical protein